MEQESNMQAPPVMCRSGCGFYGNFSTDGMCSVCFKEAVKKKQQPSITSSVGNSPERGTSLSSITNIGSSSSVSTATTELNSDTTEAVDKDGRKKKNRCVTCRKKVGLTGFECRCGGLYCSVHRYSDKHECSFNYRELGAEEIRRNNPVVVGQKIQKI